MIGLLSKVTAETAKNWTFLNILNSRVNKLFNFFCLSVLAVAMQLEIAAANTAKLAYYLEYKHSFIINFQNLSIKSNCGK